MYVAHQMFSFLRALARLDVHALQHIHVALNFFPTRFEPLLAKGFGNDSGQVLEYKI